MTWSGLRRLLLALIALVIVGGTAAASTRSIGQADESVASPQHALRLDASQLTPPAPDAPWQSVELPSVAPHPGAVPQGPAWFRIDFRRESASPRPWAVYLPYLYGGGQVWLNGQQVASVPESTPQLRVRWERPHLLPLPDNILRDGANELMVRAVPAQGEHSLRFPRVDIGPLVALNEANDRREFWVRTTPQLTVLACLIVSAFVLFIWWRRPREVLYGLFGLATVFWGIRTLTFVIEAVPVERWHLWRLVYLAATGGFVVVMALFAMRFAGLRHRGLEYALAAYWLIGPAWLLLAGPAGEPLVNRVWSGGLIPIGSGIIAVSFWAVWRQRTWASAVMPIVLTLATLAGVHDYLIAWDTALIERLLPGWSGHRLFMLHHAANLLLLTMGALLSLRFTRALASLEQLNASLESRVADRERSLSENYLRLAALERQNAAAEERQLIMREIHDGLGSKLFTSLSRVERGDMDRTQIEESLRACIADMRLALDALAPEDHDLRTALGDFLFRWQGELEAAGVRTSWTIDMPEDAAGVPPHTTLQILRIAQEALTNVVKHAQARQVKLRLHQAGGLLRMEIQDDGLGAGTGPGGQGRGVVNMHARAQRLGGTFELRRDAHGTCVVLSAPLASSAA